MSESNRREPYAVWLARIRDRSKTIEVSAPLQSGEELVSVPALETGGSTAGGSWPYITALDEPHSPVAEQYRVFAARLEGLWKQPNFQKVAITSTVPGEGKSWTTINVAGVLARDFGRRVLVIDGDFRRPSLWRFVGEAPLIGLSDIVADRKSPDAVVKELRSPNLKVLQAGITTINPTRLWKSQVMKTLLEHLGQQYEYVIVDTPPVLTVVDATLIADLMDGVVMVVRSGMTPKTMLQKALASLPRAKLVGTVLNGAKRLSSGYYYQIR